MQKCAPQKGRLQCPTPLLVATLSRDCPIVVSYPSSKTLSKDEMCVRALHKHWDSRVNVPSLYFIVLSTFSYTQMSQSCLQSPDVSQEQTVMILSSAVCALFPPLRPRKAICSSFWSLQHTHLPPCFLSLSHTRKLNVKLWQIKGLRDKARAVMYSAEGQKYKNKIVCL